MSERIQNIEALLAAQKLGKLIQKLLRDYSDPMDFHQLKDRDGALLQSPEAVDKAAAATMKDWMGALHNLNPMAATLEREPDAWQSLLNGTLCPTSNPVPVRACQPYMAIIWATKITNPLIWPFCFYQFTIYGHNMVIL